PFLSVWTAPERSEVVHDLLGHCGVDGIAGGEGRFLVFFIAPAVKLIGAAFGNGRDVADAAELRSVVDFTHTDFGNSVERREKLTNWSAVTRALCADTINADRDHVDGRAGDRNLPAVVDRHAGLSGQRAEGAGGAGC